MDRTLEKETFVAKDATYRYVITFGDGATYQTWYFDSIGPKRYKGQQNRQKKHFSHFLKMSLQSRAWLFTLNNYSSVDVPRTFENYRFLTWQAESGKQETPHLQGYILFDAPRRLAFVKKMLPTAHWETRKGTHEQAADYCNKEDTRVEGPWTLGEPPAPGKRNDIHNLKRLIDEGATDLQLWEDEFSTMLKYHKGASIYKRLKSEVRTEKTFVVVITGPTNTGKSHHANLFPNMYFLAPGQRGAPIWFDGYDNHKTLVIDEFYGWIPYDFFLRLLDKYALQVPVKGTFVNFNSKFIVITSNKPAIDWYHFDNFTPGPLLRRIDLVIEKFTQDTYRVMKSSENPNGPYIDCEGDIDFKRFVPNFP